MHGLVLERFEDEQVEGALQQVGFVLGHGSPRFPRRESSSPRLSRRELRLSIFIRLSLLL
jgi:hypothetical protein